MFTPLVISHTEGFSDVQRVGHWRSSHPVHGEPVLLHRQSLVRGHLELSSGTRSCDQPADVAAQHRGEHPRQARGCSQDICYSYKMRQNNCFKIKSEPVSEHPLTFIKKGRNVLNYDEKLTGETSYMRLTRCRRERGLDLI